MIRRTLALTGVIALTLVSAATLQARHYFDDVRDDEPAAREAVSFRGLDLTTPEGIRTLEGRINGAIDRICPEQGIGALVQRQSVRQCREDAVASVRPQVDRAVAAAEDRQYRAYRAPGHWRTDGPPPPDSYARRAPSPDHAWRDDERGWREDSAEYRWRASDRPSALGDTAPPATKVVKPQAPTPSPPGGRLVKRTIVTTTVTTTAGHGGPPPPPTTRTVVIKKYAAPKAARPNHARAYARRPAVAGSWLPPVAWAASDRAAISAFRSGRLTRWRLTDRDGIARAGHVTVGAPRWVGGNPCRHVQTVKYDGRRQIVVASGMRCLAGARLLNRSA